jgi:hypothetical protein
MDHYRGVSASAPAGTKRIGNLIRALTCSIFHSDRYLLDEAEKEVQRLNRSKTGQVFNLPAARPVLVTGMHCTGA